MLKKISCNIFLQKEIVFHEGLNAIVGDDIASNSIGKSTMLMIIDFVFGGDDYISKNHDVVDNLGHHDFRFIFNFDNKDYYFIRSTNEYKFVSICNEKFEILQSVTTEEFTAWLQEKYDCQLESLTFRNIVGRYFRIYGKENLNKRKPIQYFEKETAPTGTGSEIEDRLVRNGTPMKRADIENLITTNHLVEYSREFSWSNERAFLQGGTGIFWGFSIDGENIIPKGNLKVEELSGKVIIPSNSKQKSRLN